MKVKLLRIEQVNERLCCGTSTTRRLIRDRKLEALKIRGTLRVVSSSLEAYIRAEILDFQVNNGEAEYPADEFRDD